VVSPSHVLIRLGSTHPLAQRLGGDVQLCAIEQIATHCEGARPGCLNTSLISPLTQLLRKSPLSVAPISYERQPGRMSAFNCLRSRLSATCVQHRSCAINLAVNTVCLHREAVDRCIAPWCRNDFHRFRLALPVEIHRSILLRLPQSYCSSPSDGSRSHIRVQLLNWTLVFRHRDGLLSRPRRPGRFRDVVRRGESDRQTSAGRSAVCRARGAPIQTGQSGAEPGRPSSRR
jgi:hypothetical protein